MWLTFVGAIVSESGHFKMDILTAFIREDGYNYQHRIAGCQIYHIDASSDFGQHSYGIAQKSPALV